MRNFDSTNIEIIVIIIIVNIIIVIAGVDECKRFVGVQLCYVDGCVAEGAVSLHGHVLLIRPKIIIMSNLKITYDFIKFLLSLEMKIN